MRLARGIVVGIVVVAAAAACSEAALRPQASGTSASGSGGADPDASDAAWFIPCQFCDNGYGCVDSGPDVQTGECDGGQICGLEGTFQKEPYRCCTPQGQSDPLCHLLK